MQVFIQYNPNPKRKLVGDCVVRAICKVTERDWESVYVGVCLQGLMMHDMPSSNAVWAAYLKNEGMQKAAIPNTCPDCYTVRDFCADNPMGSYILGTGTHVVAVVNGDYWDTWDSGDETPIYYFHYKTGDK